MRIRIVPEFSMCEKSSPRFFFLQNIIVINAPIPSICRISLYSELLSVTARFGRTVKVGLWRRLPVTAVTSNLCSIFLNSAEFWTANFICTQIVTLQVMYANCYNRQQRERRGLTWFHVTNTHAHRMYELCAVRVLRFGFFVNYFLGVSKTFFKITPKFASKRVSQSHWY